MASLKQELKQILVRRQHRIYERELAAKNLTYDEWIRQQEEKVNISTIKIIREKRLTNDSEKLRNESVGNENELEISKKEEFPRLFEILDESSQFFRGTMTLLYCTVFDFVKDMGRLLEKERPDTVVLSVYPGRMSRLAIPLICQTFGNSGNTLVVYGDEDTVRDTAAGAAGSAVEENREEAGGEMDDRREAGVRENPWFKPGWSPDRFLSSFYFGGLVAIRGTALCGALQEPVRAEARSWLYSLLFEILKDTNAFEKGHDDGALPVSHIRQVLFHNKEDGYKQIERLQLPENKVKEYFQRKMCRPERMDIGERPLLSIIIPSRDNVEALFECLDSLTERTQASYPLEVILVDNGSREKNREKILRKVRELNGQGGSPKGKKTSTEKGNLSIKECSYLYQPMPFNFSKMCNIGAENAKGELLLFLNDDMEIMQPDWLDKMAEKALLPYAGAVGTKLLYPDSDIIQHAGITNLRVGPAHKLQFLSDGEVHYFGMNRGVHNMLAATGACLMMRRDVFFEAGGFCEELAVAFNDVDLCYTIFENGYYNIVRNDMMLYHHESLSRGNDGDSPEKQLRLLGEKDRLYERHQPLYGCDPFYHPYLTTDMLEQAYSPSYRYQVTLDMPWSQAEKDRGEAGKAREDKCLVVGMECAMDIFKWKYGVSAEYALRKGKESSGEVWADETGSRSPDSGYYFQGYSFIIGADNACYKKKLLLRSTENGGVWQVSLDSRYRPDIKNNLRDQTNVDLTGFAAKLKKDAVPAGVYQFGMLAEDKCSRQKLVNWSNWVLEVGADGKSHG
ncbi:MAG: glycosyltransferase [Lachnospiraceae bacterium]|jgi:GT2 family glycosyltransferase|nr:glycosyltransferase [Lachnospiraceae bacterium]